MLFSYTSEDLRNKLIALGLHEGDTVLMHSGFSHFSGFTGSPDDVIDCLLSLIGENGNLLMMSMPYGGSSQAYAESGATFDVLKTPSALGIISETFRRRSGVIRSANPLHPVLAAGPMAKWLTADHERLCHSCGKRSPFARFLHLNGKLLFYDAIFRSLTFVHYVEDRWGDRLPVRLYEDEPATIPVKLPGDRLFESRQFLFSKIARERRNFSAIENALTTSGQLVSGRIGNTNLLLTSARDVLLAADSLVENGDGFYC